MYPGVEKIVLSIGFQPAPPPPRLPPRLYVSNGSVLSPMVSESENDEVDGHGDSGDGVNARGKGQKKNWRRKKAPAEATADGNTEASLPVYYKCAHAEQSALV